jgi:hypothetical protein
VRLRQSRFPVGAMPGLPSASAVRRAGVAAAIGAGLALVGISVHGIASMDGTLRAATERPQHVYDRNVSFVTPRSGSCWRGHSRSRSEQQPSPSAAPTT